MYQVSTETQHDSLKPAVTFSAVADERALRADDDLLQSPEVKAAINQLGQLAGEANEAARTADDHATENPEAERDAQRAREAADIAVNGQAAIKIAARSGDKATVASVAQRTLGNARTAVSNAVDIAEDHEHSSNGSSSERSAHGADIKTKEQAKKKTTAPTPAKKPKFEDHNGKKNALAGVLAHADGDDDDIMTPKKKPARKPTYGVRDDDDDGAAEVLVKKAKRVQRGTKSAVQGAGVSAAESTGYIGKKKVRTADNLFERRANATTDKDYDYSDEQISKAIDRNVFGDSFLEQEVQQQLLGVEKTAAGKRAINKDNTLSSSLWSSSVMDRLRANGYVEGQKGWNWEHDKTEGWSHRAVQRIDRNGDKQLSAAEIAYAMEHRYVAPKPKAAPAAPAKAKMTAAEVAAHNKLDTNDDGKVSNGELAAALKAAGHTLAYYDKGKDGFLNDAERVNLAAALPRTYGASRPKGK